ncbi:hypothetical protein CIRG_09262 [Coccidioides immitis RMSCC 2394]|uniref:Secreted protein n=1 Tax=Coccidioides immitis RMSCC 2394 TaxID=404692 RepID=A0A0J6YRY9_COCIT|nr:hypothetical protein CIRG_09262 [Coccidioides immitis RMSCC 2394]
MSAMSAMSAILPCLSALCHPQNARAVVVPSRNRCISLPQDVACQTTRSGNHSAVAASPGSSQGNMDSFAQRLPGLLRLLSLWLYRETQSPQGRLPWPWKQPDSCHVATPVFIYNSLTRVTRTWFPGQNGGALKKSDPN